MKKLFLLLLTGLLLGCSSRDMKLIDDACEMVDSHPDSALYILNKVENLGRLSDEWVAKYWTAKATAHQKTGQALSEDSAIVFAMDYYASEQPVDSSRLIKTKVLAASYYYWTGDRKRGAQLMKTAFDDGKRVGDVALQKMMLHGMAEFALMDSDQEASRRYVEEYGRLCGGDANNVRLLNSLAICCSVWGDNSASETIFRRIENCVKRSPDSLFIWQTVMRNHADILLNTGEVDRGIALHNRLLGHYRQAGMAENISDCLFSLSYGWLLKGDKAKAREYFNLAEHTDTPHDEFSSATPYNFMAQKMVLDYAQTGRYRITDIALYANKMRGEAIYKEAVASARERSNQLLREHELLLTLSRQRQFIFFLLLSLCLSAVILCLVFYIRRRRRLIEKKDEEAEALRKLLADALQSSGNDDRFVKKIMLQQLGIIRHAASNPTTANQQLLQRMAAIASRKVSVDYLLDWDDLYKTIDSLYDGYYTNLRSRYSDVLNEREMQLCCLLKADFSTKEISFVTQQSVRTVYQRKSSVRQKLNMEEKEDIAQFLS